MTTRSLFLAPILVLACAHSAQAQSFNVDIGDNLAPHGLPPSSYGAAANQTGTWNARSALVASTILTDVGGVPSAVTLTRTASNGGVNFTFDNLLTTGSDDLLLDDTQDVGTSPSTTTWTFNNLQAGMYALYTYAWAPDSATFVSGVSGGSIDPLQSCGGTWTGAHVQGVTYARHRFNVLAGGSIAITVGAAAVPAGSFGTVNGLQLTRVAGTPATAFCFGDGSGLACPCGNSGAAGNGCTSSVNANGANLAGSGLASIGGDTFLLTGSGMPNSSVLYFQGTTQLGGGTGNVFGDGLRCAGGSVIRLLTKSNVGGGSVYPGEGEPPISVRGANAAGDVRTYQAWYRNAAAFCTVSTFNLTNGVQVTWIP